MTKLCSALLPPAALLAVWAAAPARADSLSCTTVNGETHCARGSSSTSCVTIDGHTECRSDAAGKSPPLGQPPGAAPPGDEDQRDQEDRQDDDKPDQSPTPPPRAISGRLTGRPTALTGVSGQVSTQHGALGHRASPQGAAS